MAYCTSAALFLSPIFWRRRAWCVSTVFTLTFSSGGSSSGLHITKSSQLADACRQAAARQRGSTDLRPRRTESAQGSVDRMARFGRCPFELALYKRAEARSQKPAGQA